MNIKQLAGVVVFVLVFGVVSNSLANHAFADTTKLQQQNTVSDKPEGKTDKADTVKNIQSQVNTIKTDSKTTKNTSQIKPKHVVKTTNHLQSKVTKKVTTTPQKTTTSTVSKNTRTVTDKPEGKTDKADTVKSTKKVTTTPQKTTTSTVSKNTRTVTDKPEGKTDKADTVKGTK